MKFFLNYYDNFNINYQEFIKDYDFHKEYIFQNKS